MTSQSPLVPRAVSRVDRLSPGLASSVSPAGLRALSVAFVTVLTAAASQVSVPLPFTPVPFTVQPMVVLLGAAVLGSRLGALSQILYLLLGVAGLPVFAFAPALPFGVARLLGPTAGFLMAYPVAAALTGWLAERGMARRYVTSVAAMGAGLAVIFAGGAAWLATTVGWQAAFALGVMPFVAADIVKVLAAGVALRTVSRWLGVAR